MTMDPSTGEGFDAVEVDAQDYFDPNASSDSWPGVQGLQMRRHHFWQGDVEFDTFEEIGPTDESVQTADGDAPAGDGTTDPTASNPLGLQAKYPRSGGVITDNGLHEDTPCLDDDGTDTTGETEFPIDIILHGGYGGDIIFPVTPEEIAASFTHDVYTPKIVGLGEISIPGGDNLETITWDSFLPAVYDHEYCVIPPDQLEDPLGLAVRIINTMRSSTPCFLVVGNGLWNDNVLITSFDYQHKTGDLDLYYKIALKRYRVPVVTSEPAPSGDRWFNDPREATPTPTATAPPDPAVAGDGTQTAAVPINPDLDHDVTAQDVAIIRGQAAPANMRSSLISIDTDYVQEAVPGVQGTLGETIVHVVSRLGQKGPNQLPDILNLNDWMADFKVNSEPLPVGHEIKYYKETPVQIKREQTPEQKATTAILTGPVTSVDEAPPPPPPNVVPTD